MPEGWEKLPSEFIERVKSIFPPSYHRKVLKAFTIRRPTTFRVNTLKSSFEEVKETLKKEGFKFINPSYPPLSFILVEGTLRELEKTSLYKEGKIYVQTLSSMLPPLVLAPEPGERILDLCAAPGSKTTQMSAMMENEGEIVAVEKIKIRFYKLKANLERQGVKNVKPILRDGTFLPKNFRYSFDRVLVDAPCSGEGSFTIHDPRTYAYWGKRKIKEMVRKQKRLLLSGILALKPGGVLVYSTCTLSPEENEGVLDWVLKRVGNQVEIEKIEIPAETLPGLGEWEGKTFSPEVKKAIRIPPSLHWEGFFIAKIRKNKNGSGCWMD